MGKSSCCPKDSELNKGAWTAQEDFTLSNYIATHGEGQWRSLPRKAGLKRCGKSCRLRWLNYLRPDIKRGNISSDEKDLIIRLHDLLGNRWSLIAGRLPGRTDNEIKNYWNTYISKSRSPEKGPDCKPRTRLKLGSHDGLTSTPLKVTPLRLTKGRNQNGNCDHEEVRSMDGGQSIKGSLKSWPQFVGEDLVMEEDTSGSEENDGNEANMSDTLVYLKKLSSPDHDLKFYPFDYSMENIVSNGYEEKSFRVSHDETMDEIDTNRETLGDWVVELESACMNRTTMPSFTTLLMECEHDWEREILL